jgi:hypothetical protein
MQLSVSLPPGRLNGLSNSGTRFLRSSVEESFADLMAIRIEFEQPRHKPLNGMCIASKPPTPFCYRRIILSNHTSERKARRPGHSLKQSCVGSRDKIKRQVGDMVDMSVHVRASAAERGMTVLRSYRLMEHIPP